MLEELWAEVDDIVQEAGIKTIPKKKKCKKAKWLSEEALQTDMKRREAKSKGGKERYTHLNAEFQRTEEDIRKPSSVPTSIGSSEKQEFQKNIYFCFIDFSIKVMEYKPKKRRSFSKNIYIEP